MKMETLNYKLENGIASITLNLPDRSNSLNSTMVKELSGIILDVKNDPLAQSLLLQGTGASFCAGGDITEMVGSPKDAATMQTKMRSLHPLVNNLLNLDIPVIAVVDGPAFGAGFSLAICADYIVATPRAKFSMSFGKVGLIPDCGAFYTLPRLIGLQRAKDLILSSRVIDAEEALKLGIVSAIYSSNEATHAAHAIAEKFNSASQTSIMLAKRALNASLESDLQTMLNIEAECQVASMQTEYHKASVERFLTKKKPIFDWDSTI